MKAAPPCRALSIDVRKEIDTISAVTARGHMSNPHETGYNRLRLRRRIKRYHQEGPHGQQRSVIRRGPRPPVFRRRTWPTGARPACAIRAGAGGGPWLGLRADQLAHVAEGDGPQRHCPASTLTWKPFWVPSAATRSKAILCMIAGSGDRRYRLQRRRHVGDARQAEVAPSGDLPDAWAFRPCRWDRRHSEGSSGACLSRS